MTPGLCSVGTGLSLEDAASVDRAPARLLLRLLALPRTLNSLSMAACLSQTQRREQ
jgi:hypothetical protein